MPLLIRQCPLPTTCILNAMGFMLSSLSPLASTSHSIVSHILPSTPPVVSKLIVMFMTMQSSSSGPLAASTVGERTNGALKSALRTSTFKASGKQVFVSNSSGKRIPVSSGKRNNSNSDSILDGYYDRLISNLDGLKPSKIEASHLKSKLGDSSLTI